MEALILIFGAFAYALFAPFVTLIANIVGLILSMLGALVVGNKPERILSGKAARAIALAMTSIAVLVLSALWIVNSFYFDRAVQHVFGMVEKRSGITTTCQQINGSVFAGRVDLGQCTIRRASHPTSSFDLSVDALFLDIRVTSLLGTARIKTARVTGLEGWVTSNRSGEDGAEKLKKPRRAFVIDQLDVSEVRIDLAGTNPDGNPFELPINIERIDSQPLRSRLALFDILFRSNATGSIAGAPFKISTSVIQDGRVTTWRAEDVPVAKFGAITGGPLSWFSSGSVDLVVDDQWQHGDSLSIDMDWRLAFKNVRVDAPAGAGMLARVASKPLVAYVNGLDGHFPFEFQMVVNENQFEYMSSLAAAGFWSAVGDSINKILAELGIDIEKASETAKTIGEGARSVLDKLRKPKSDKTE